MNINIFNWKSTHLENNNVSYIDHLYNSLFYAKESFLASFYFFIHGFFPDLFEYNGSTIIKKIHTQLQR